MRKKKFSQTKQPHKFFFLISLYKLYGGKESRKFNITEIAPSNIQVRLHYVVSCPDVKLSVENIYRLSILQIGNSCKSN